MKQKLMKNGLILSIAIIISVIFTVAVAGFGWSFKTFSDMLTYAGIVVMGYGAYTASNMSNLFSGMKRNMNERYSKEEKKEKEDIAKAKLVDGWLMLATGAIIMILSVLVVRI
ncbi:MAG: hypothetical protein JEZ08_03170 [Clostridiales bacterium]|nr:hypothetical protein [Clostridiales bacterium]